MAEEKGQELLSEKMVHEVYQMVKALSENQIQLPSLELTKNSA